MSTDKNAEPMEAIRSLTMSTWDLDESVSKMETTDKVIMSELNQRED